MLSPEYVTTIEDWLKWYNNAHNQLKGSSLEKRIEFIEKGIRGAFVILPGLTQEVERVDIGKARAGQRRLVVPVSF